MRETITDRMMLLGLIEALLYIGDKVDIDDNRKKRWRDYQENIYPLSIVEVEKDSEMITVLSAGVKWDGEKVKYNESKYPLNTFGMCQLAGVFPAEVTWEYGDNKEWELSRNTATCMFEDYVYSEEGRRTSGHGMVPILAARLRMGRYKKNFIFIY